ncbi:MAG: tryptophan-rich sensory protein, partial [Betaproteobacteria bacterium]|nr:tryptophan-rich sensory protein [Betaproteobacteria bacterium]
MKSWRGLALAFVLSFGTAGLGGAVTDLGPWYQALQQPPWKPPDWAFGPIWTTLFSLMAISGWWAWRVTSNVGRRRQALVLWAVNGACNVGWSFLFFKLQRPDWALMEWVLLWSSIAALMMALRRDSNLAAWLLLPYLL